MLFVLKESLSKFLVVKLIFCFGCMPYFAAFRQSQSAEVTSSFQNQVVNDPTYESVFKRECWNMVWSSDLRDMTFLSFLQLYNYLVVRTEKCDHTYIKTTPYKKLKAFQFYYEGLIRPFHVRRAIARAHLNTCLKPFWQANHRTPGPLAS